MRRQGRAASRTDGSDAGGRRGGPSGLGWPPMRGHGAVRRALTAGAAAALLAFCGGSPARADDLSDLKDQRNSIQAKKAKVAAQVDALKASDTDVSRAIDTIQGNVSGQRAA